jgi:integrase
LEVGRKQALIEARARLPGFLARTDREIAIARGQLLLTIKEQIDRLASTTDLQDLFMQFCGVASPLSCTKSHAAAYRTQLLERVSPNTAKTTLNYLSGIWSILEEVKPGSEHIFKGLAKRIKVVKADRDADVKPIESWTGSVYAPVFKILYYTGARLSEIAGLMADDLLDDRILIRPNAERSLKTSASEREIPLHPKLHELVDPLRSSTGFVWPQLQGSNGLWGHNLSKPCKVIAGVNPHGLRHRAATCLREMNFNEITVGKLLGHVPSTVTGNYGSVPWSRLVEAVQAL